MISLLSEHKHWMKKLNQSIRKITHLSLFSYLCKVWENSKSWLGDQITKQAVGLIVHTDVQHIKTKQKKCCGIRAWKQRRRWAETRLSIASFSTWERGKAERGPTSPFPTWPMEPSDFKPSDRAAPSSQRRHQTHTRVTDDPSTDELIQTLSQVSVCLFFYQRPRRIQRCHTVVFQICLRFEGDTDNNYTSQSLGVALTLLLGLPGWHDWPFEHCQTWNSGNKTNITSSQESLAS